MSDSEKLADYELGQVLGVGTVGTIYEASRPGSDVVYAIKVLHPGVARDGVIKARFRREMAILSKLTHPNIIHYYGGGEEDGQLFFVMERVDGGTAKDLLDAFGRISWREAVACGIQAASALQYAHNHGIIHRDLKPSNLFFNQEGQLKLGDFGIARDSTASSDITASGITVGTHAYMAPEQIIGDSGITGKADLYSLGCCLFELITGRQPFVADHFAQLFHKHLNVAPDSIRNSIPDCPPELDELIQQLLAKKPGDRPFSARQVQGRLLQIGEQYGMESKSKQFVDALPTQSPWNDVAAADNRVIGIHDLKKRIELRMSGNERPDVSWKTITLLTGLTIAAIAAAVFYSRLQ